MSGVVTLVYNQVNLLLNFVQSLITLGFKKFRGVTHFFKGKKIFKILNFIYNNNNFFPGQGGPVTTLALTWSYQWILWYNVTSRRTKCHLLLPLSSAIIYQTLRYSISRRLQVLKSYQCLHLLWWHIILCSVHKYMAIAVSWISLSLSLSLL